MKVLIQQRDKAWTVTALEGHFQGCEIAVADGVSLIDVDFSDAGIMGHVSALWGAQVAEGVSSDFHTMTELGLGKKMGRRWFDLKNPRPLELDELGAFDLERGVRVTFASQLTLLDGKASYQ